MESVGIINKPIGVSYSLSGPVGRSLGIIKDQRFNDPYETFKYKSIPIIYTKQGDNLSRFFIRIEEIFISIQYIEQLTIYLRLSWNSHGEEENEMPNILSGL